MAQLYAVYFLISILSTSCLGHYVNVKLIDVPSFEKDKAYCKEALGMTSTQLREVKDANIKFSRKKGTTVKAPYKNVRYNKHNEAWCPRYKMTTPDWIQIKFQDGLISKVTGMKARGFSLFRRSRHDPLQEWKYRVQEVSIQYGVFENELFTLKDEQGKKKIFKLKPRTGFGELIEFQPSFHAAVVKLFIEQYTYWPCINFEFYGCDSDYLTESSERIQGKPTPESGCPIFDFENGTLHGWKKSGDAFNFQPTYGDNLNARNYKLTANLNGLWYISTGENRSSPVHEAGGVYPSAAKGEIISPPFKINTTKLTYLIGGGGTRGKTGMELRIENHAVYTAEGSGRPQMKRETINVGKYIGKSAVIRLFDYSHQDILAFDDLRTIEYCTSNCKAPLGMQSGKIKTKYLTASESDVNGKSGPTEARLNNKKGAWCVSIRRKFKVVWYEINLRKPKLIDGFTMQNGGSASRYVKVLRLYFSPDDVSWIPYTDHKEKYKYFNVRESQKQPVRIYLNPRITARRLRFYPIYWGDQCCMRFEIYGCDPPPSKTERVKDDTIGKQGYKLGIYNANNKEKVKLPCIRGEFTMLRHIVPENGFEWYHLMLNTRKKLSFNKEVYTAHYNRHTTGRMVFQCLVRLHGKVFLTSEFIVKHHDDIEIVFLDHPLPGHIGGRRLKGDPAYFYSPNSVSSYAFVYVFGSTYMKADLVGCCKPNPYIIQKEVIHLRNHDMNACIEAARKRGLNYFCLDPRKNCLLSENLEEWLTHRHGSCPGHLNAWKLSTKYKSFHHTINWRSSRGGHFISYHVNYKIYMPLRTFGEYRYKSIITPYHGPSPFVYSKFEVRHEQKKAFGTFRVEVWHPAWQPRILELRNEGNPVITLPKTFGLCNDFSGHLKPLIHIPGNFRPTKTLVYWFKDDDLKRTLRKRRKSLFHMNIKTNGELVWKRAYGLDNGTYTIHVANEYGYATKSLNVTVVSDYPRITWITPSPHVVVEAESDILEVKLASATGLQSITWSHNGKVIAGNSHHHVFPDGATGNENGKRRLKLQRLLKSLAGEYKVEVKGQFCQFTSRIIVNVHLQPLVTISPSKKALVIAVGKGAHIFARILGGDPKPQVGRVHWYKNGVKIERTTNGSRYNLQTTKKSDTEIVSQLSIRESKERDSGEYKIVGEAGKAMASRSIILRVYPEWKIKEMEKRPSASQRAMSCLKMLVASLLIVHLLIP